MFKKGERVRHTAMLLVVVGGILAIFTLVTTFVNDDSSTANGAIKTIKTPPTTVTLIVTGSRSDVTYNNGYKAVQVKGPFKITMPLRSGHNYSVASFNTKPGTSTCQIKVGTKLAMSRHAVGQGNTAGCVLTQVKNGNTWMGSSW